MFENGGDQAKTFALPGRQGDGNKFAVANTRHMGQFKQVEPVICFVGINFGRSVQFGKQVEIGKHGGDFIAERSDILRAKLDIVKPDGTRYRAIKGGQKLDQGGFARPVAAGDENQFALFTERLIGPRTKPWRGSRLG